jgi:muramidase (phage lysozyme)
MLSLPLLLFVSALQAQDCSLGTHHLIGDLSTVVATNPGVVHATELSPEEKAFLDVIAYAEGVGASYNTMYGGKTFSGTQHPRKWTPSPWGTPGVGSDAAGRYQFLSTTWDEAADGIGVSRGAFTPINQDRAAIWLIKKEGKSVHNNVLNATTRWRFESAVKSMSYIWASLPPQRYPGQHTKSMSELWKVFQSSYATYSRGGSTG